MAHWLRGLSTSFFVSASTIFGFSFVPRVEPNGRGRGSLDQLYVEVIRSLLFADSFVWWFYYNTLCALVYLVAARVNETIIKTWLK